MTHPQPRVAMKPDGAATGCVDGGWWPRSLDPTTAFPELVTALRRWIDVVNRISYHLELWEPAPRKQTIDGRVVRSEGFRSMDRHTVTVIGNTRRLSLLVVPPDTPGAKARATLRAAADRHSTATVEEILTGNDIPPQDGPSTPVDLTRPEQIPEQRWEAEGGYVHTADRHPTASRDHAR